MQICMMDYDRLSPDGKSLKLMCYGVGSFDVLSGNGLIAYGRIDVRGVPDFSKCIEK